MQLTILRIDIDLEVLTRVNSFQCSSFYGIDDRRNHVGALDAFLLLHVFEDG